jgi:nitrite reductase/ring-hydroxylating ferredoxin subunit/uncharacterized membrane protein
MTISVAAVKIKMAQQVYLAEKGFTMKTKASVMGHPVHQMMIPFPIAFLSGALIFDILGTLLDKQSFWTTGGYLAAAGILMALAAAIPGFIDYFFSIPPASSGKKRGTKHMIVNLSAVVLFLIAFITRLPVEAEPGLTVILLEAAGTACLSAGGWLGDVLVNRNFIGPDHRYANAGKWNETVLNNVSGQVHAASTDELKTDQMKLIILNGKRIVLAHTSEGYFAFDDSCSHRGGSLADGVLICGTVQCLWHGSQFNIKNGSLICGPAKEKINTYKVIEKPEGIFISVNHVPV